MDEKDKRIKAQDKRIKELENLLAKTKDLLSKALDRIAELERRLGLDSSTSGKPPSSDGLRKKPAPRSLRISGKNPSGGQKGHKGLTLSQVEDPEHRVVHKVDVCPSCQKSLINTPIIHSVKRQVFDIADPKIEVTEHQAEIKICSCGCVVKAGFPKDVHAPVQYGARVKALAIYFAYQQMIPEDRLSEVFKDLFGLPVTTATLATLNESFATKIFPLQETVLESLKKAPVKNLDETGIRIGGKTQWLHVISSNQETHYRVSQKRGNLLDGLEGIAVHDHWKPYFTLDTVQHALCNAHHLRELKALENIEKEPWAFKMSKLLRVLSRLKQPSQDSPLLKRIWAFYDLIVSKGLSFHEKQDPLSPQGKRGRRKRRTGHNLLLRLKNYKECVLMFLVVPDVPFTNNQAEQDVRMMKVKQKISGGFRTTKGAEIFCLIRGFLSTKRKQNQNLFQAIKTSLA